MKTTTNEIANALLDVLPAKQIEALQDVLDDAGFTHEANADEAAYHGSDTRDRHKRYSDVLFALCEKLNTGKTDG